MKMQLKPMLFIIAASGLVFTGCQKSDGLTSSASQSSTVQPSAQLSDEISQLPEESSSELFANAYSENLPHGMSAWLTTTTVTAIGTPPVVLKTGTFTASRNLGDTGLYVMHIHFFDPPAFDSIHCVTTMYTNSGGSFMTDSRCSIVTNIGKWVIIHGSGRYTNLHGHGTVDMVPGHEMATGTIRWE